MSDAFDRRFLLALQASAEAELGADDPCSQALGAAAEAGDPAAAQAALASLPGDRQQQVMAGAHRRLVFDPAGWLGAWRGGRPH